MLAFTQDAASVQADVVTRAGAGFAVSLMLVPFVFMAAAFLSKHDNWPIGALAGMGIALGVGLSILVLRNPIGALIAGYAAGAVVSLARPAGVGPRNRIIAAVVVAVVVHVGLLLSPPATAWIAPALPFTAMGIADALSSPRADEDEDDLLVT